MEKIKVNGKYYELIPTKIDRSEKIHYDYDKAVEEVSDRWALYVLLIFVGLPVAGFCILMFYSVIRG